MPNYRRYYIPNAIMFITVVTKDRQPFLKTPDDVTFFFQTLEQVQLIHPFHLLAYIILPDHFHWLMNTENAKGDFSIILKSIKWNYTLNYKKSHHISTTFSPWQRRFWDHVIRDEQDLKNHMDYIHWNPVKHGYVKNPELWKYSTYSFWYQRGYYPPSWASAGAPSNIINLNFE